MKSDNTFPISYKINHNRISTTIRTGYSVEKDYWNENNSSIKKGCKNIKNIVGVNYFLKKRELEYMDIILDLDNRSVLSGLSIKELKFYLTNKKVTSNKNKSFLEYAKYVIENLKQEKRFGTAESYKESLAFLIHYSKKEQIMFHEINASFLKQLEKRYMNKPGNHYNGLAVYLRSIRAIFNRAIAAGVTREEYYPFKRTPYDKFKYQIRTEATKKRAISKQVMKMIENFEDETEAQKMYRYYFLFSFYTMGMNMVDIAKLRKSSIKNNSLYYKRSKTGKTYEVNLNTKAWDILLFFGYDKKKKNDLLFPLIKNPEDRELANKQSKDSVKRTNKYLKQVGEKLGLQITLTTYVSRHTWATIADKSGIDRRIISQGLGHSNLHTTEIYINDIVSIDDLAAANDIITGD